MQTGVFAGTKVAIHGIEIIAQGSLSILDGGLKLQWPLRAEHGP